MIGRERFDSFPSARAERVSEPSTSEPAAGRNATASAVALLVVAAAIGGLAAAAQRWFAPVGVFPLFVGAVLGFAAGCVFARFPVGRGRLATSFVVAAALTCAATSHYATYRLAAAHDAANEAQLRMIEGALKKQGFAAGPTAPIGFVAFVERSLERGRPLGSSTARGAWLVAWWIVDVGLMIGAATVVASASSAGRNVARVATPPQGASP